MQSQNGSAVVEVRARCRPQFKYFQTGKTITTTYYSSSYVVLCLTCVMTLNISAVILSEIYRILRYSQIADMLLVNSETVTAVLFRAFCYKQPSCGAPTEKDSLNFHNGVPTSRRANHNTEIGLNF